MFCLKGRIAVVSGASSGQGAQMAKGFAEQGADVVITARRVEKLEALAEEISLKYGVKCFPVKCDVTDTESVNNAMITTA
ncbi:MAG: SDR family NAD(P)-dependent oxidoreductase [Muribaculaceae bacterium]|nr:SDR family NAD(P)-dependent oxidoreductase [Muribaculaceae bacterium]MDE6552259.1 SDR family NAD(P)-dependent oxidoreductase [Muribaculaceae bacterium]